MLKSQHIWSTIATCSLLLFTTGCKEKQEAPKEFIRPVSAYQATEAISTLSRSFPGLADPVDEVNLSFRVPGPLVEGPVDVGVIVKKEQLLAKIDPTDYQLAVDNVKGQLDRAQASLLRSTADYKRALRIKTEDPGAITERAMEKTLQDRDADLANIRSLEATLKEAENQLDYTNLLAPFDGIVVARYVENFEQIAASQQIVRIVNTGQVEMVIHIPEIIVANLDKLDSIKVRFDSDPDNEWVAEIKELGTEASETTRTYPVTLTVDHNEKGLILPGMTGQATVQMKLPEDMPEQGIEIPPNAVANDKEGRSFLWVINESTMTVSKRYVDPRWISDATLILIDSIKPGDWVVTAGIHYLEEGQKIRIME